MNKLYGLFFVPAPGDKVSEFTSASLEIEKLQNVVPHVTSWTVTNDPHDKTLKRYSELPDNSKYLIREIPFVC